MKNKERDYALDFLKFAATGLIVLHHYQQCTNTYFTEGINFYDGTFSFGYVVELFFVLSGYFMLGYGEKIQKGLPFKVFYGRRMMRLLPMVAVTTVAGELLLWAYRTAYGNDFFLFSPSLWALLCDWLGVRAGWSVSMLGANNPTWYISVLLLCCLIFYLLNYLFLLLAEVVGTLSHYCIEKPLTQQVERLVAKHGLLSVEGA